MQEFTTVSSSSYDPSALAAKLNDKSAEGWAVVSIVSTGGDVTAFLSRASTGTPSVVRDSAPASEPKAETVPSPAPTPAAEPAPAPSSEPTPSAVVEPAGWAVAPDPAPAAAPAPDPMPVTNYSPAPATATPAVPAGWYADPAGRYELRYWDGGTWTEHVSRAGQQYTDPPVA